MAACVSQVTDGGRVEGALLWLTKFPTAMFVKKNMGTGDRVLRVAVALLIVGLYYAGVLSGTWTVILLVLASIFVLTGFVGICPLYLPFGLSTRRARP